MIPAFTNHLWQSTLFVVAAWLVASALRQNGAHVRHRIWLIASVKFLVPFSLLISLGSALPSFAPVATPGAIASAPDLSLAVDRIAEPFTSDVFVPSSPVTEEATTNWTAILIAAWASGVVLVVLMRLRDWRRVREAVRASVPVALALPVPVRSAPGLLEPGVVGLFRPLLLVPAGIEQQLTPKQLEAVLAHELCHVRRRDNLTSAIHMVVEAVFWFHPLVWFVGARLVAERERACDEHVLCVCGEPTIYAESILNVCKLYVESPIACVSGLGSPKRFFRGGGADLKKRIAAIMINRVGRRLNVARKAALVMAAILAVGLPLVAGALTPDGDRMYPDSAIDLAESQSAKADRKFDVASIKPCGPDAPPSGARAGSPGAQASPGYLNLSCFTLKQFVSMAYAGPDHPLLNRHGGEDYVPDLPKSVRGGPSWAYSETYTFEATERQSMYVLTVAKSGLKIKPMAPGECWVFEPGKPAPPHDKSVGPCGSFGGDGWGSTRADGVWMGDPSRAREGFRMVDLLWQSMFRVVLDKTDLNRWYSFALDFTPDDTTPGVQGRGRPGLTERPTSFKSSDTIFKAIEKLGLKLEQTKAPSEYLVVDSAQRPRPDSPSPIAPFSRGFGAAGQPVSMLAFAGMQAAAPTAGQTSSSAKFDVISIKPCDPKAPFVRRGDPAPRGFRGSGAPYQAYVSPGYAYWDCVTLAQLVDQAYVDAGHPLLNIVAQPRQNATIDQPKRVRGGPAWVEVDKFAIEVRAPLDVTTPGLAGSSSKYLPTLPEGMSLALRAALEDRFKLKVHRATEQQDMYALAVAKGGLNPKTMTAPVPGDCATIAEYSAAAAKGNVLPMICGRAYSSMEKGMEYSSFTLQQLALDMSTQLDHFVIDRTGITTPFNFTIKGDPAPGVDRYTNALAALGLRLEAIKGPAEYLAIDSVEKPRPNSPFPADTRR
jgi:uncharacterized protein (TIGR03435 family)